MTSYHEIDARSLLRRHGKIKSWFLSRYGLNPYRSCVHDCTYCDGRAEIYYTRGDFGQGIGIKGVGKVTERIVRDILDSRTSRLFRSLAWREPGSTSVPPPAREKR